MAVKTITAEIDGKVRQITADIPDDATTEEIQQAVEQYLAQQPVQANTWADKLSQKGLLPSGPLNSVARGVTDLAEGATAGLASTIYQGGDLIRRATGQERIINNPEVQRRMSAPESLAGKAGKFGEQAAEFILPIGLASKIAKAAQLGLAGKVALEAATSGAVTGMQTGGDPLATGIGIAAGATGPILKASNIISPAVIEESAAKQYGRVLNATTKGNKWLSKNTVVPGLIERRVSAITLGGLKTKIGRNLAKVGASIGDEWDALPEGTVVKLDSVMSSMDKNALETFTIETSRGAVPKGPLANTGLNHIEELKGIIRSVSERDPKTGELLVPVDRIRNLRQYYDEIAAKAGRYEGKTLADQSMAEAHGMAADAIREELAKQFPSIDVLNKEYHFWKDAAKVVGDTIQRREGQARPLGRKIAGAAGAASGMALGGVKGLTLGRAAGEALETAITSPAWNTVSALLKDKLAQSLAKGAGAESEFYIGQIMKSIKLRTVTGLASPQAQTLVPATIPVQ